MAIEKIAFCTDFSENSTAACLRALEFAKAHGAELCIVHVARTHVLVYPTFEPMAPVDLTALENSMMDQARQRLKVLADECRRVVGTVRTALRTGSAAEEIVKFAEENGIDLIVMGTHGWTGLRHLILGSTAENVARTATCPVLTVRSSSKEA